MREVQGMSDGDYDVADRAAELAAPRPGRLGQSQELWRIRRPDGTFVTGGYTSEAAARHWLAYEQREMGGLLGASVVQALDRRGRPVDTGGPSTALVTWPRVSGVLLVVPAAPDALGRRTVVDHLGRVLQVPAGELAEASGAQVTTWRQDETFRRVCADVGVADG